MIDSKMVIIKLLGPTDLTKAQIFYIYKLSEVIFVKKNKDLVFAAF